MGSSYSSARNLRQPQSEDFWARKQHDGQLPVSQAVSLLFHHSQRPTANETLRIPSAGERASLHGCLVSHKAAFRSLEAQLQTTCNPTHPPGRPVDQALPFLAGRKVVRRVGTRRCGLFPRKGFAFRRRRELPELSSQLSSSHATRDARSRAPSSCFLPSHAHIVYYKWISWRTHEWIIHRTLQ